MESIHMASKPVAQRAPSSSTAPETHALTTTDPFSNQNVPEWMRGTGGQGIEGLDASDMETPRLSLLQPTSPQVTDYENARPGMYWHNMLNEPVGDAKKGFIGVIAHASKRAVLWRPRPPVDTGGILARSHDLKTWNPSNASFEVKLRSGKTVEWRTGRSVHESGLLEWGSSDPTDKNKSGPPAGTLIIDVALFFPEYPDLPPAVYSYQLTGLAVGKRLMGWLNMSDTASFGVYFRFGSDLVDSAGNKYYVPTFSRAGYVNNPQEYERYKSLHLALQKSGLKMRDEADEPGIDVKVDIDAPAY
jgi:hypothetical protein